MDRLNIGIIGAGYIGGVHASVLARDERVRVSAVQDIVAERAEQLARSTGATVYPNAEALIEASDAIYITTPNTKHTALALEATAAGKHIFCEIGRAHV